MRIVVAGARGQLGAAVVHECAPHHDVVAFDRAALDVTDDRAVAAAVDRLAPDAVINCTGYNDVDGAETHPVEALNVNAFAVRALARAAARHGAAFVHYGTDFVFDGAATAPYTEDDVVNPRSVYAASKLVGEWFAADAPRAYVLRVESLFGRAPGGPEPKGSAAVIARTMLAGGAPRVFEDRTVSPTFVTDAAHATRRLLEAGSAPGLYHCVNSGRCTWLEFAECLAGLLGIEPRVERVRLADVAMPAERPRFCALSNAKLAAAGIEMPTWQEALSKSLKGVTG